ncbi:TerD family protein [Streptomyces sp. NPDC050560]|uniref:TerD family protein n=1 Tax=Streptomyces sp. NPDC050560 TaxID=3365630 RepID=UPI00379E055A
MHKGGSLVSELNKGLEKVEVGAKWDPSPLGTPPHDLDIIAATYSADDPQGEPAYLVYFDHRSPDGTISLDRDSRDGSGFGYDEIMTVELYRLSESYSRVIVGVAIQQTHGRLTFGQVARPGFRIRSEGLVVVESDFAAVADATAAVVAEFVRDAAGAWTMQSGLRGFVDADPTQFAQTMGSVAH